MVNVKKASALPARRNKEKEQPERQDLLLRPAR